jgi:hypothetical protein
MTLNYLQALSVVLFVLFAWIRILALRGLNILSPDIYLTSLAFSNKTFS